MNLKINLDTVSTAAGWALAARYFPITTAVFAAAAVVSYTLAKRGEK